MDFTPVLTVAPAALSGVMLDSVKAQLRVVGGDDDAMLAGIIDGYGAHLDGYEGILGRALLTQTWRQDFACFADRLSLPLAPVQSIASVSYVDSTDATQTLATSVYELLADGLGPYVARKPSQSWPGLGDGASAARVSVSFVAGYGATADDLPGSLRQAITLAAAKLYGFAKSDPGLTRETVQGVGTFEYGGGEMLAQVDAMVGYLIAPYRRVGL